MGSSGRRKILIATTNPGKIREIRGILADAPVELVTLTDLPAIPEPDENGTTFADNARLKALYYAAATGLPSVADDSGLEIDALDKAPGVHSARWHGYDYSVKFGKIYELLAEKGVATSVARFVAAVGVCRGRRRDVRIPRASWRAPSRRSRRARTASATTRSSSTRRSAARSPKSTARRRRG